MNNEKITFFAIIMGVILGSVNVFNLLEIIEENIYDWASVIIHFFIENAAIVITIVFITGIVLLPGLIFMDKIIKIKWKCVRWIIKFIVIVSFIISFCLMIVGTTLKLSISIEDKLQYEFVTIDEKEYVVLSEYDDKILVVRYEVGEHGQYTFDTSEYWFYEKHYGTYRYINLKYCPEVSKEGAVVCE